MTQRPEQLTRVMQRVDGAHPGSGLAKHHKMTISPFVFLRGASSQFYDDLAQGVSQLPEALKAWPLTGVIGDCHISNFGMFSEEGSHGDHVIFAPNDFDDACVGHAGWDLLRLATSLILCADHCDGVYQGRYPAEQPLEKKTVGKKQLQQALEALFSSYTLCCEKLLFGNQDYNFVLDNFAEEHILSKPYRKALKRTAAGEDFALKSSLAKAVDLRSAPLKFRDIPERFTRLSPPEYQAVEKAFAPYVDDTIVDITTRIGAGTGSVNMQRYYLLVGPKDCSMANWPQYHIVEVKKQRAAAPLHEFAQLSPVNQLNPAHLTIVSQRRMQRNPDLVLDEVRWNGAHWLVRSRHHAKVGIDPEDIAVGKRARSGGFSEYAATCGEALALAHSRYDRRSQLFEQAVVQDLPRTTEELIKTAHGYAEQVKQDWEWLSSLDSLCEQ